jgi:hypothetical protein
MNTAKRGILIFYIALVNCLASAQLPDGVTATQSFMDSIITNYDNENLFYFDLNSVGVIATVPVRVLVIMNKNGSAAVNPNSIYSSINIANGYFKNAGINFYVTSIVPVSDYNYSFITNNNLRKELLTRYTTKNEINLFLVDSILMGPARSYGFTYFPDVPDSNYIYLDKNFIDGSSLTTMLGHFMGLLSTHETARGKELSSEKNCSSAGDFICDTYADPGLFDEVIDNCRYIGTMKDDNGKYFVPSVANIMSDSPSKCRCILTPLQYRRIYYYFMKYRQYLK